MPPRTSASTRFGLFIGYNYFHQTMNAYGCVQLVLPGSVCDPTIPSSVQSISQEDTWQSLRLGISAETKVGDRFRIVGDVAYLPYARFNGLDIHLLREPATFFPQEVRGAASRRNSSCLIS
jgi:hypothetical protein